MRIIQLYQNIVLHIIVAKYQYERNNINKPHVWHKNRYIVATWTTSSSILQLTTSTTNMRQPKDSTRRSSKKPSTPNRRSRHRLHKTSTRSLSASAFQASTDTQIRTVTESLSICGNTHPMDLNTAISSRVFVYAQLPTR
uniref:Uncharacterized protein n=1 Tax=Schizaphis graminum TaxID=13262 RepID=A0A2S2PEH0_SCHGA